MPNHLLAFFTIKRLINVEVNKDNRIIIKNTKFKMLPLHKTIKNFSEKNANSPGINVEAK